MVCKGSVEHAKDIPAGGCNKTLWHDLKTVRGAVNRVKRELWFWRDDVTVFSYTNIYDNASYRKVAEIPAEHIVKKG